MKICPYKFLTRPLLPLTAMLIILAWAVCGPLKVSGAAEKPDAETPGPIEITSDRLVTDSNANTAEFSGNVTAVQGGTTVTADRLVLHYASGEKPGTGASEKQASNNIKKIEAYGHVRIAFDNRVAVTEQAVYTTNDRILTLKGAGSKVTSGSDVVTGSLIVFDRQKGQVSMKGDDGNQVKAVIHTDQRGLN